MVIVFELLWKIALNNKNEIEAFMNLNNSYHDIINQIIEKLDEILEAKTIALTCLATLAEENDNVDHHIKRASESNENYLNDNKKNWFFQMFGANEKLINDFKANVILLEKLNRERESFNYNITYASDKMKIYKEYLISSRETIKNEQYSKDYLYRQLSAINQQLDYLKHPLKVEFKENGNEQIKRSNSKDRPEL